MTKTMKHHFRSKLRDVFLSPLAWIWKWVYRIRRFCYDYGVFKQESFQVPIISVGNLTFGGTGKTPFTLWIGQYFEAKKKKPLILMRGYRGKLENKSGIILPQKRINPDPIEYGDEALIFARRLLNTAVVVGKKRSANLKFYFPSFNPDVVILDDGHQHLQMKRVLNIVLFDALMPMPLYQVAPIGRMREDWSALKDADLIVIGRADQAPLYQMQALEEAIRPKISQRVPVAHVTYRPKCFYNSSYIKVFDADGIKNKKVICIAGLASPLSFFKLIESLGAEVLVTEAFPDHHYFTFDEINSLLAYAKNEDAYIVTTEKDIVRMKKVIEDESILFLEIDLEFLKGEEETKQILDSVFDCIY